MWDTLWIAPRVWDGNPALQLIEEAAIAVQGDRIAWLGASADLSDAPTRLARSVRRLDHGLVTPGLIDCHTHLVFAGDRADEYRRRLAGESYASIAAAGGGIQHSVRQTRAASIDELYAAALPRARQLISDGVTTIEIKSGYGLELEAERRMLKVARRLARTLGISVRTTYLGLHALPFDAAGRTGYVESACNWLETLATEGLVDAVDAYHEGIAFSATEVEQIYARARRLGLAVKLHADQLANNGGAALAAHHGALSADHVEYTDAAGIAAMASSGTVAVLLPAAFLVLRETRKPPVAEFRAAGVPMAVATDLNPGTSPLLSLRTAMSLAVTLFGVTIEEALAGVTGHAAQALGLAHSHGTLAVGRRADFVHWNVADPAGLVYWIGGHLAAEVVAGGSVIHRAPGG
jgi:imidazolonepropionase